MLLDTPLGKLSFVFEGAGNGPETEGSTLLDIPCESPSSILRKKLMQRVIGCGRFLTRDFYDFAWAATQHPDVWSRALARVDLDELKMISRRCHILARCRRGQPTGPPINQPLDRELARNGWNISADLFARTALELECSPPTTSPGIANTLRK